MKRWSYSLFLVGALVLLNIRRASFSPELLFPAREAVVLQGDESQKNQSLLNSTLPEDTSVVPRYTDEDTIDATIVDSASTETKPSPTTCPDGFARPFGDWKAKETPKVFQLSAKFGFENAFEHDVKNHTEVSRQIGVFDADRVFGYYEFPEFILSDPQWTRNLKFLSANKKDISWVGAGYWFWKPALIQHHLQLIDEGDFLVYVDNDVTKHWRILPYLLQSMIDQGKNLALIEMKRRLEKFWTKRDVYEAYCHRSQKDDERPQFEAMFIVLRKDKATMQLVHQYFEGVKDWHALSDEPSWLPDFDFFRSHRRDQSILNGILKCRYQEHGKKEYIHPCKWRRIKMFSLPVWTESEVHGAMNRTEAAFREQESLHRQASEESKQNPLDPIWSLYS